ncbi:unnamed protein product [Agarophyton chilense]|eukprot:gb/GEZJ01002350.1/.p2 GENE.gb/GEZJ01002350.1/~~gb/GEZJ01002350.1/.p2  ORF type:complete len:368 (-),score=70.97 gb/GEZJ01002350.1/:583-1686(-)
MKANGAKKEMRMLVLVALAAITSSVSLFYALSRPALDVGRLESRLRLIEQYARAGADVPPPPAPIVTAIGGGSSDQKRLLFYNRPPKTGSTTVRIAVKRALDEHGLTAAKCFNMIEWNEMGLKTIINRRDVDFYGCHTRMTRDRYDFVSRLRGGNVTFVTNTREPSNIILSAYLQENRDRKVADITDDKQMEEEIERFKKHVESYPVDALYRYHGADVTLNQCPIEWVHEDAMRRVAERYEVVIDLSRPEESTAMMEAVTGLRPDFTGHFNERTTDTSGKMLTALKNIDTSHKTCGNELVHKVLMQQYNIIKDRLMQNRCFDEGSGSFSLCEKAVLKKEEISEKNRKESYAAREALVQMAGGEHPSD